MSDRQRSVAGRLRLGATLTVVFMAAIIVADLAMYFAIQAEIDLVAKYGFGHVPRGLMAPYVSMGGAAPIVGVVLGLLKACGLAYFLYQTAKALDLLGIAHRFSKIFTGLSIFIPFVSFYVPWAALGEARQTFQRGAETGTGSARSVRAFDLASFGLGCAWIFYSVADLIIGAAAEDGKIVDLQTFTARLSTAQGVLIGEIALNLLLALVFFFYTRNLMHHYRNALVHSVSDVFTLPADAPAPPVPTGLREQGVTRA